MALCSQKRATMAGEHAHGSRFLLAPLKMLETLMMSLFASDFHASGALYGTLSLHRVRWLSNASLWSASGIARATRSAHSWMPVMLFSMSDICRAAVHTASLKLFRHRINGCVWWSAPPPTLSGRAAEGT
eukprot:GHVO01006928.1.p1 GENE.GHVO01006928.1~~GHVO01006928.1.p1  ORF type:complete len:130 (+),score=10.24 GHVO01006928.1:390-779(+)